VLAFLLLNGALPKLKSEVSKTESETLLDVSVRWSHTQVVRFLLENVEWSKEEVKSALGHLKGESKRHPLKVMLREYGRRQFGNVYTFCCLI